MPRQQASRQQPINSFSTSSDSSTSYLSARPKSHSPRSNFNPFSPLSPHPPDKELEGSDQEDEGAMFNMEDSGRGQRRIYSRTELLNVARRCRERGWVKPMGMGSLESWYGAPTHAQDPAIASIGPAPNRRNGGPGGFGEGFGYGGGIGGKGLGKGGRHNGPRRNEHEGNASTHGPLHGPSHGTTSTKDLAGGPMGKFAVKSASDRMKLGGDENRRPKDEWRRDKPPHQAQRNDQRHWQARQEEDDAAPAWMDDQPDHDPAISEIQEHHVPGSGEDLTAAHKRAGTAGASNGRREPLVGFFATETAPPPVRTPVKPVKEYNAANYLLPKTRQPVEPDTAPAQDTPNSSRFARFFGNPGQLKEQLAPTPSTSRVSGPSYAGTSRSTASTAQSPPPAPNIPDRTAALMATLLTASHEKPASRPSAAAPSPPPAAFFSQGAYGQMQLPTGYGLMPPHLGPSFRPMPQQYPGQAPPLASQQHIYGGQAPPQLYPSQRLQGFLPAHQPPYLPPAPPPPPGFALEQHQYYSVGQGHIPMQQPLQQPQPPRDAAQQERNMNMLLNQWQTQHPR